MQDIIFIDVEFFLTIFFVAKYFSMWTWMKFEMDEIFGCKINFFFLMKIANYVIWMNLDNMGGRKQ